MDWTKFYPTLPSLHARVAESVVFLVEIFWAAVNFGWKWPALAPPDPPLHPSLCSLVQYQPLAANEDDDINIGDKMISLKMMVF